ncbi:hypothetical protein DPMN_132291 [Dreissena polymorpha]|uniref:Uncharacterized protein n=1 Tax=Dreissena polymorpha TaxID=45954 RepID=A0A9D4FY16_DREPO|nr:hypothetical protein DPMN_132291 [Dreissena polymorpha]
MYTTWRKYKEQPQATISSSAKGGYFVITSDEAYNEKVRKQEEKVKKAANMEKRKIERLNKRKIKEEAAARKKSHTNIN